jgi:hypothetical protein
VQVIGHLLVALLALVVLLFEDAAGRAAVAGEEEQEIVLQVVKRLGIDLERGGLDVAVGEELEAGEPAIGGDILVLLPDRLLELLDLDLAGLLGQCLGVDDVLAVGMQGLEDGGGEAAGGPQPGAGRCRRGCRPCW